MWEARDFKRNNVLVSINCFLVDEKNTSIIATIHPHRMHKFRNTLIEGAIFSVTTFELEATKNYYRLTDHPYKIFFNEAIGLGDVNDGQYNIPLEYFRIRTFADVQMMVDQGLHLPDVVGQISCIRTSKKIDETNTPPKSSVNLLLTCTFDGGQIAYISLRDKYALLIKEELVQHKEVAILVIAAGVNPKTVGGKIYLNALACTRLFFNVDNLITEDCCKSTHYRKDLLPTIVKVNGECIPSDIQTISQVMAFVNAQGGVEQLMWCKAKVVDVILSGDWYYITCAGCSKKMDTIGGKITCQTCPPPKAIGVIPKEQVRNQFIHMISIITHLGSIYPLRLLLQTKVMIVDLLVFCKY